MKPVLLHYPAYQHAKTPISNAELDLDPFVLDPTPHAFALQPGAGSLDRLRYCMDRDPFLKEPRRGSRWEATPGRYVPVAPGAVENLNLLFSNWSNGVTANDALAQGLIKDVSVCVGSPQCLVEM